MPVVGGRDGADVALVLFWHHLGTPEAAEWRSSSAGGDEGGSSPCLAEEFLPVHWEQCWEAFFIQGNEGRSGSSQL